jgi:hypothetical protein
MQSVSLVSRRRYCEILGPWVPALIQHSKALGPRGVLLCLIRWFPFLLFIQTELLPLWKGDVVDILESH